MPSKTNIILGLGNIGAEYAETRHNTGFKVVERLASKYQGSWHNKNKLKADIAKIEIAGRQVLLVRPTTYYNLAGEAAHAVLSYFKLEPQTILVVHDELDLPFGRIRARMGGGSAGNNGIKNISSQIGDTFGRLRIGIANERLANIDPQDFVLSGFSAIEKQQLDQVLDIAERLIIEYLSKGEEALHTSVSLS